MAFSVAPRLCALPSFQILDTIAVRRTLRPVLLLSNGSSLSQGAVEQFSGHVCVGHEQERRQRFLQLSSAVAQGAEAQTAGEAEVVTMQRLRVVRHADLSKEELMKLVARPRIDFSAVFKTVEPIVADVQRRGDEVVRDAAGGSRLGAHATLLNERCNGASARLGSKQLKAPRASSAGGKANQKQENTLRWQWSVSGKASSDGGRSTRSNGRLVTAASASNGQEAPEASAPAPEFDVSSNCVTPVFRSGPARLEQPSETEGKGERSIPDYDAVHVMFLSEGNVCRSVYAEAIFSALLRERGLADSITCSSRATRDYNLGEAPDTRALEVAAELQLELPEGFQAQIFRPASDIVALDVAAVMDKFVAADVLKEVSVFDTIDPTANYSAKVRRLGDFCRTRQVEDIDDPLYGNMGGPDEKENLRLAYNDICGSCEGLLEELLAVRSALREGQTYKSAVSNWLRGMPDLDWMVPPMLQKRTSAVA
eukprot:TRINITY_DN2546_c0_g1_i5.p1 TRINITY_DN2546_c0_g1~~TRINITY_DN2546_c0_g1_i5.p1  ORF type:complete len:482 (+),score=69.83 TRINITY_DN2546_c0_g1_i5:255-1700(+)